ncbi:MAG: ribose-phosphate diphosphokinase [Pseudomonadales bacterium]|nr:ribose-phosphate diphosphokinase [Pseudomonadales bacterium]
MLLYAMPGQEQLAASLRSQTGLLAGTMSLRRFPDGETYIRILDQLHTEEVAILAQLHHPDEQFLSLLLLISTLRDLGVKRVGLIAPYLPYMRQDKRFAPGEGVSARYFANILGKHLDWLLCVDPHLHRIHDLTEVYTIPARAMTAVAPIADWISAHLDRPLVIGPDSESEQWAASVARLAGCEYEILNKIRHGDREVEVSVPVNTADLSCTPVLVDDIVSTGKTMIQAARQLLQAGYPQPVCIAVHGLFAPGALQEMQDAGLTVVTSNSIAGQHDQIDLAPLIASGLREMLEGTE